MSLTPQNYTQGYLVDDELMSGIHHVQDQFLAFVLRPATGEYLGLKAFVDLDQALNSINQIPRDWTFEAIGGCGDSSCGQQGACDPAQCKLKTPNCAIDLRP